MTIVRTPMTMALRWTKCCGRREKSAARCVVYVIILCWFTSSVLLWMALMNRRRDSVPDMNTGHVNVLLFSYYRSGSTLLGSMFDLNPDAFYWFEPLAAPTIHWGWVDEKIPPRNFYHYDNGTEKSIPLDDLHKRLSSPLSLIYDCNLTALHPVFFMSYISSWLSKIHVFTDYNRCIALSRSNRSIVPRSQEAIHRQCLPILVDRCRRSNIVAVKTIRLKMGLVEEMMQRDATLRLVYMVRDPRGMLNSWWTSTTIAQKVNTSRYSRQEMVADARLMCKRILSDWRIFARLRTQYPTRCLQFRYEDLAASPEAVVQTVYRFLGFYEAPIEFLAGIRSRTLDEKSGGVFGVRRRNSSATAQRWKTQLAPDRKQFITDNCHELLQEVGYQ